MEKPINGYRLFCIHRFDVLWIYLFTHFLVQKFTIWNGKMVKLSFSLRSPVPPRQNINVINKILIFYVVIISSCSSEFSIFFHFHFALFYTIFFHFLLSTFFLFPFSHFLIPYIYCRCRCVVVVVIILFI